jgi:ubiquinone/menaquinone biosynthesis C-methylase UbiE
MTKKLYGLCLEEYQKNKVQADVYYKRAIGAYPEMESSKAIAKFVKKYVKNNYSILDVGCACGQYFRSLNRTIKKNFTYTGVDPYDIFLDKAKKAWRNYKNVSFKKGNIFKLPFKNGEFDIVICNNVLLHIPNLIKPIKELLRVAKRTVIIRTHIHDKSYRIQLVYNNKWWKYTNVKPKNEFDKKGNPRSFSYFDVVSEDYFKSIVLKPYPKAKIVINEDNFFNAKLINKSSKKEKRPGATKIVNGMQVSDLLILPNKIVEINK